MSDSESIEAERWLTTGTICLLVAAAGFGYGFSLLTVSIFLALIVWALSVVVLYIGWALAVNGLVLVVRIALHESAYSQ